MAIENRIPLTEYSSKYSVSISTLRRRIKAGRVECTQQDGKYLLKNSPLASHNFIEDKCVNAPTNINAKKTPASEVQTEEAAVKLPETLKESSSSFVDTTNKLLNEVKKAYALVLQEKEEQIFKLKEDVSDLKTLVRVLEADNERLKSNIKESAPIDSWLETFES